MSGEMLAKLDELIASYEPHLDEYPSARLTYNSLLAFREQLKEARVTELEAFVQRIADRSCERFPHPPPGRDGDLLIFPSNCLTQKQKEPCRTCSARLLLDPKGEHHGVRIDAQPR